MNCSVVSHAHERRSWEEAYKNGGSQNLGQPAVEELANWESQFNQLNSEGRLDEELDYDKQLQDAYEQSFGEYDKHEPGVRFDDNGVPELGSYAFGAHTSTRPRDAANSRH